MKRTLYKALYCICSFLSDYFDNRYLTKYKVLLGTSLLMLVSCQMIKKDVQDEGCLVSTGSDDDSFTVSCYLPNPPEEPDEGDPSDENYVHKIVDELPEFPGGEDKMKEYIHKRIKYPMAALEKGYCGIVFISVIVEKDGTLSGLEVFRGVDSDLDKEALRIIKGMPKWKPGKQNGIAVRVKYVITIHFRMPC